MPRYLSQDLREDLAQERAIAEWLGEDPKVAQRKFLRQEHRFYDIVAPFFTDDEIGKTAVLAAAPLVILRANRTPEGKAARAERNRIWWRTNGAEYRRMRKERDGKPLG
jgi:hypothetical protein